MIFRFTKRAIRDPFMGPSPLQKNEHPKPNKPSVRAPTASQENHCIHGCKTYPNTL